jgi:hypothetical protein
MYNYTYYFNNIMFFWYNNYSWIFYGIKRGKFEKNMKSELKFYKRITTAHGLL